MKLFRTAVGEGRNPVGLFNKLFALVPRCGSLFYDWIPACAGMTN
jgi:hypothetical protein